MGHLKSEFFKIVLVNASADQTFKDSHDAFMQVNVIIHTVQWHCCASMRRYASRGWTCLFWKLGAGERSLWTTKHLTPNWNWSSRLWHAWTPCGKKYTSLLNFTMNSPFARNLDCSCEVEQSFLKGGTIIVTQQTKDPGAKRSWNGTGGAVRDDNP